MNLTAAPGRSLPEWLRCPTWCQKRTRAGTDNLQFTIEHEDDAASFSLLYMHHEEMLKAIREWWAKIHSETPPNLIEQ